MALNHLILVLFAVLACLALVRADEDLESLEDLDEQVWSDDDLLKFASSYEACKSSINVPETEANEKSSLGVTSKKLAEWNFTSVSKNIDLSNRGIVELEAYAFSTSEALSKLNVSNNLITRLGANTFNCSFRLRILDLSSNLIDSIDSGAFDGLTNLYTLYLESNRLKSINKEMFKSLENLNGLNLAKNEIDFLNRDSFASLKKLSWLSLADNQLVVITEGAFKGLENLEVLNLAVNQIFLIESSMFADLIELKSLVLASNEISTISPRTFDKTTQLVVLDLNDNKITSLDDDLFKNICLKSLNLDRNEVMDSVFTFYNLQSCLVVERIAVNTDLGRFKFNGHLNKNVLKLWEIQDKVKDKLNLEYHGIKSIEPNTTFLQFTDVKSLSLYKNYIVELQDGAFANLTSLSELNLQGNQLARIEPKAFESLSELLVLDLSFNKLAYIEPLTFQKLIKLTNLYLNNNKFMSIDSIVFRDSINLKYLDLSANPLVTFENANILSNPVCLTDLKLNEVSKKLLAQTEYAINANGNNQICQMTISGSPIEKQSEKSGSSKSLPLNYRVKGENLGLLNTKDAETIVKSKIEKAKALIKAAIKASNGDGSSPENELKITFNLNINIDELL